MPLYEYECPKCRKCFSRTVEKGTATYPCGGQCSGVAVKQMSVCGVSLKGKGFHEVDYATFDRAVGADADKKWAFYEKKRALKKKELEAASAQ